MTSIKTLFHRRTSGAGDQSVDSWYLVKRDDGTYWVEHLWRRAGLDDQSDAGSSLTSVGMFFARTQDQELLGSLRVALTRAVM